MHRTEQDLKQSQEQDFWWCRAVDEIESLVAAKGWAAMNFDKDVQFFLPPTEPHPSVILKTCKDAVNPC